MLLVALELGAALLAGELLAGELLAGELLAIELEVLPPSIPQGAGKAAQLVRPTQLCPFSQPQPLGVLLQIG